MILKQEYCLNILESLTRPGGESTVISNDSLDPLRPLISLTITKGATYNYIGTLEAQVHGLTLDSADSVFQANCFDHGCFQDNGLWTEAIKTNVSRVYNGKTQYWIRGDLDNSGNIYVADVGYIYKFTGQPIIKEANIPLYAGGKLLTVEKMPAGIKFIRIKRVNAYSSTNILHAYGEYENPDPLIRSKYGYLLNYNAQDQCCDLEDISITLISLISTRFYNTKDNQYLFRTNTYTEPSINIIIENNISRLVRLIDIDTTSKRYGSIPRYIATYSEPRDIYGYEADKNYANPILDCFDDDCFKDDCFESLENKLLISREVSTRAMAWFLLAICNYQLANPGSKYKSIIDIVSQYIINEFDIHTFLPTDGWTHSITYTDSERINKHSTSTAVICCIALVKAFEITNNALHLDIAADIYNTVIKILRINKDNLFVNSYEEVSPSYESIMYGLMLTTQFNRADITQDIISFLYSKTRGNYGDEEPIAVVDSNSKIISTKDSIGVVAKADYRRLRNEPALLSFFYPNNLSGSLSKEEILKYNTLITHLLDKSYKKGFSISFYNTLQSQQAVFNKIQLKDRIFSSSVEASTCLLNQNIFETSYFKLQNALDLHSVIFYRSFLYDKLKYMWPSYFSWVSPEALSLKGNLGRLLYSISRALASLPVAKNLLEKNVYIASATDNDLDRWGEDLYTPRFKNEIDEEYKYRLSNRIAKGANTKGSIIDNLAQVEVEVEVADVWRRVARTHSATSEPGDDVFGRALLPGNDYATNNIIDIQTNQPFNQEALDELSSSHSAGVKPFIRESLSFRISGLSTNKISFLITENLRIPYVTINPEYNFVDLRTLLDAGTPYIDLELILSWEYNRILYVKYSTIEGTALANEDYVPAVGVRVEYQPGETLKRIRIYLQPKGLVCYLLDEDGNRILSEDGTPILLDGDVCYEIDNQPPSFPNKCDSIQTEINLNFLTETGNYICIEDAPLNTNKEG